MVSTQPGATSIPGSLSKALSWVVAFISPPYLALLPTAVSGAQEATVVSEGNCSGWPEPGQGPVLHRQRFLLGRYGGAGLLKEISVSVGGAQSGLGSQEGRSPFGRGYGGLPHTPQLGGRVGPNHLSVNATDEYVSLTVYSWPF